MFHLLAFYLLSSTFYCSVWILDHSPKSCTLQHYHNKFYRTHLKRSIFVLCKKKLILTTDQNVLSVPFQASKCPRFLLNSDIITPFRYACTLWYSPNVPNLPANFLALACHVLPIDTSPGSTANTPSPQPRRLLPRLQYGLPHTGTNSDVYYRRACLLTSDAHRCHGYGAAV